ncbi:MAG: hypothetical protein ACRDYA_17590 [Egibacteraceae bacterium]
MADRIKRHYDLTTLKLSLHAEAPLPAVHVEFEVTTHHVPETVVSWRVPVEELGLPASLEGGLPMDDRFALPEEMVAELRWHLHEELDPERPLWLHLVKPYGFLGAVPWEALLQLHLDVPILRLPDFIVEPVRSRNSIDVLLCAADSSAEPIDLAAQVEFLAGRIAESLTLPTTVHVFTDSAVYAELLGREWQPRSGGTVLLYEPAYEPAGGAWQPADPDDNLLAQEWLRWMRDELPTSVDVAHFVVPGHVALGQGAFVLPAMSAWTDRSLDVVGAAALNRFTTQIGAWSVAFTCPRGQSSAIGLRLIADALAQVRPGPVLYHDLAADRDAEALMSSYVFLYADHPAPPPRSTSVFLYCQPFQVSTEPRKRDLLTAKALLGPPSGAAPSSRVRDLLAAETSTPAWIAASQRYVEQCEVRLQQWAAPGAVAPPEPTVAGVEKALELIQEIVHEYADAPQSPPSVPKPTVTSVAPSAGPEQKSVWRDGIEGPETTP